ncbi:MAG TPA: dihydropteroate synthase [Thermodesulfobacteriota bacterium]|jgi:5-methyltetrahydrofolate corrinoid/iron sulfur protein methyltransferase|nr:dihydropteroate synthase [Thermodesulfobacteriota bacterium]
MKIARIAESINVMSKTLGPAMKGRDPKPIQEMAIKQQENGVQVLDINIGPARKEGDRMMEWMVKTVEEVSDLPLSLDTTNPVAMEAGLKAVTKARPIINSISLQPERMAIMLPMVTKYNARMIALLWGKDGMPRDTNERALMATELVYAANQAGVLNEDIFVDPIVSPVSVEINQVLSCAEFMSMIADIAPGAKTTVGLSNISNGTPDHLRGVLNRTYMIMLNRYETLYSAIVDAFDGELAQLANDGLPEIYTLVWRIMDGEEVSLASLSEKEVQYAKSTRVLMGKSLYSHSWLDV